VVDEHLKLTPDQIKERKAAIDWYRGTESISSPIYSITGLKRDTVEKWRLFNNVNSLEVMCNILTIEEYDYAVIYDKEGKIKLGYWNNKKGIVLYTENNKVEE